MAQLSPHLTFNGNCREAFDFYRSAFGGEFSIVMKYGEVPDGIPNPPGAENDKLIHISLPISADTVLMGCDMPAAYGEAKPGNNFNISVNTASRAETEALFASLGHGGSITMPLADTFWGAYFGMLTDKFGIQWMLSYNNTPQQ